VGRCMAWRPEREIFRGWGCVVADVLWVWGSVEDSDEVVVGASVELSASA